jgi:hypothetical protein
MFCNQIMSVIISHIWRHEMCGIRMSFLYSNTEARMEDTSESYTFLVQLRLRDPIAAA